MSGNEMLLARIAGSTWSIITGAPRGRCSICRFCVAADLSTLPNVDLITDAEFEAQLEAIAESPVRPEKSIWFAYLEPLLHPRICAFVEAASARCPGTRIFVVTSGLLLTPELSERLASIPRADIGIALNTLDPGLRSLLYGRPALVNVTHALRTLPSVGLAVTDLGSTELVERDLDAIASLRRGRPTHPLLIRRLEHTRFSPPDIVRLSLSSVRNLSRTLERVLDRVDVFSSTDLDEILRFGPEKSELEAGQVPPRCAHGVHEAVREHLHEGVLLCAAPSAFGYWSRELAGYGDAVRVVRTENATLGGTLDCAGLMTVADARGAVGDGGGRSVFLPRIMFGEVGHDVLGARPEDLPERWRVV